MRVLFVEHTGLVSGAQRSLLELLRHLPGDVERVLACGPGPLRDAARAAGARVVPLRGTAGSLKLHPLHTPRAVAELAQMGLRARGYARSVGADVIHANGVRAGLIALAAQALGAPPPVVHVRDVLPDGRAASLVHRLVGRRAAAVVAISRYTADAFERQSGRRPEIVYNAIDTRRLDPARVDRRAARRALGLDDATPVLVHVAQITSWKGQDTSIRVLAGVRARHPRALLLLVGETKFVSGATRLDNRAYRASLEALVRELGVADGVRFLGERDDVPHLLAAADVALLPSHEEPFGRSVVEAMAMALPVVATDVGGPREAIEDGRDGLLLDPDDDAAWTAAVSSLLDDPAARQAMGIAARATAVARFGADAHVRGMLAIYARVAARA